MAAHQPDSPVIRWPTGVTTLIGLVIGAGLGIVAQAIPVGMVAGLAVGVGIDSLLNHRLNAAPTADP